MIKDLKNLVMQALGMIAAITTDTVTNGVGIDTSRAISGMFTLSAPIYSDGTFVFTIEESVDNSVWTPLPSSKYIGVIGVDDTITAASAAGGEIKALGCFSNSQYIRLVATSTGTTSGATIVSHAILTPELQPSDYPG